MTKKSGSIWIVTPGLRLLRSLTLGYYPSPLRGFKWISKVLTTHTGAPPVPLSHVLAN